LVGEVRGLEFVPITFAVADGLAYWRAEVPGKVVAAAEALSVDGNQLCEMGHGSQVTHWQP
jgi:hypothetical protein